MLIISLVTFRLMPSTGIGNFKWRMLFLTTLQINFRIIIDFISIILIFSNKMWTHMGLCLNLIFLIMSITHLFLPLYCTFKNKLLHLQTFLLKFMKIKGLPYWVLFYKGLVIIHWNLSKGMWIFQIKTNDHIKIYVYFCLLIIYIYWLPVFLEQFICEYCNERGWMND